VLDSRPVRDGAAIRRRRECIECRRRFTSYEQVEATTVWVVKKDGRRERFDRGKILHGLMTACEKRPIAIERLETLVDTVEREIHDGHADEVHTEMIGESVMKRLQELDEVAYVRFASVYRQFTDIEGFRKELERMLGAEVRSGARPDSNGGR
jgi:transcriptional repressor NrdR